ncbi:LOW QUALITY PROTEIN: hypothetical protein Dda_7784 [Drechslerella dactyloides]|uniref:Carbohydrate kinase PfkB domain-containing protein n=1 Tax=Drechslerella dactyloides TaxID=74499 RepID=A0AAD6NEZ9_DREDA|nr:LOW QUALITY PROTEIN: hypothetical protein Dda_7784 [Drechslerella dactyloides]
MHYSEFNWGQLLAGPPAAGPPAPTTTTTASNSIPLVAAAALAATNSIQCPSNPYQIHFATLGMFILDKIDAPERTLKFDDLLGGAGSYAVLGARLMSQAPLSSKTIGWIVDAGNDFPDDVRKDIIRWNTNVIIRENKDRKSTRGGASSVELKARRGLKSSASGHNVYGPGDFRSFTYLTPKIRLTPADFVGTPLIDSLSFHLICSPARCMESVKDLHARRTIAKPPIIVWEPVPDLCTPEQLVACAEAIRGVDIFSPNASELGALCSTPAHLAEDPQHIQKNAEKLFLCGVGPQLDGPVIVRAGSKGCYVRYNKGKLWLPAYYAAPYEKPTEVADPTGGGNCFLGALAVQYARCGDLIYSVLCANVAASFAIWQLAFPQLAHSSLDKLEPSTSRQFPKTLPLMPVANEKAVETWPKESVSHRLEKYVYRKDVLASLEKIGYQLVPPAAGT